MSQLPEAFENRMKEMLSKEYEEFYAGYQGERHRALRWNPLKTTGEEFLSRVSGLQDFASLSPVPWEKRGFYYDGEESFPGKHPFHEAGVYYIQEPSAMAPVPFLEIKPGERVLDLCAAPGGKSTQIAGYLKGEGLLVSNEIHPQRAKILSENMERMGIQNGLVLNETPEKLSEIFVEYFDKILVDAPCSGEGMFRKNENAGEEWSPENVELCAERQSEILDCAAKMLKKGGRLVYSTCTFAPAENEEGISAFLNRHEEFLPVNIAPEELPEGFVYGKHYNIMNEKASSAAAYGETNADPRLSCMVRIWPHRVAGEGHFFAVMEKTGETVGKVQSTNGSLKGKTIKEYKECKEFLEELLEKEVLEEMEEKQVVAFGDQLYLVEEDFPSLNKLKVLRPGLHLGTMKKNRFEPSHALALALSKEKVKRSYEISLEEGEAKAYLSGMTLVVPSELSLEKGWYLITVKGYSLGFAKLAGGILKNHYPIGLRK